MVLQMKLSIETKEHVDDEEESNTSRLSRYYRMVDQHVASFQAILSSPERDWEFVKQKDGVTVCKYDL